MGGVLIMKNQPNPVGRPRGNRNVSLPRVSKNCHTTLTKLMVRLQKTSLADTVEFAVECAKTIHLPSKNK